ncbi:hypothetical protein [Streptomyces palmae]|uniref:Uncharacterized protein n=1 Tax=Streptomyces palmae TaxID=1701085 RepID=A0A4Z0HAE5_9ACTN|nr:hypothetical protein [Streptomyces palmae]TGB06515.1 hypothetical protein E4099_18180 [Streptomyces palmae]
MADPVSRTILLFDIERYSDRDDVEQAYLRRMLYDIADGVLEAAGIEETRRQRADRGDSVIELIDANASVAALLRALLTQTPVELGMVNRLASTSAQIRLRAVLASGYVAVDAQGGWVGSDLNHACRLLDAEELRELLRSSDQDFALCVSEPIHQGIVQHGHPGIPPERFRRTAVASKNGPLSAWLYGPGPGAEPVRRSGEAASAGSRGPAGSAGADASAGTAGPNGAAGSPGTAGPAGAAESSGSVGTPEVPPAPPRPAVDLRGAEVRVDGGFIAGDNHGVSTGSVTGDIHFGGGTCGQGGRR